MRIIRVPVLSRPATAGKPADGDDDFEIVGYRYMPSPFSDKPNDRYVVVVVAGDSLLDAGIKPGDWVMYRMCEEVPPGALCMVATPDGLTIKYWHPQGDGCVHLLSANPAFKPQTFQLDQVQIRGEVVMSGVDHNRKLARCEESSWGATGTDGE